MVFSKSRHKISVNKIHTASGFSVSGIILREMNNGKEIAGIAFPFSLGILLSAVLDNTFAYSPAFSGHIVFAVFSLGALLLLRFRKYSLIVLLAFTAGWLCHIAALDRLELPSPMIDFAKHCGQKMQDAIDRLPFQDRNTNALLKALLTGNRNGLSKNCIDAFRISGASHILALSGLHIGIIYAIIRRATSVMGRNPYIMILRSILNTGICLFYVLCTGAGASIVRAFLFIFLYEVAILGGRSHRLKTVLPTALFIQLAIDPAAIGNISFQLSYAALAGITYIHPHLSSLWENYLREPDTENDTSKHGRENTRGLLQRIWELMTLSLSCQITTAPLAWHYFRSFPPYFLLTNLLAVPLVGILIPTAVSCIAICGIFPDTALSGLAIITTEWLAGVLQTTLDIISKM